MVWDPSSVEEEDGGEENRLLKLTKHPVPTSDAPEQVEDDPSGDVKLIWRFFFFGTGVFIHMENGVNGDVATLTIILSPSWRRLPVSANEDLAGVIKQILSQLVLTSQIHRVIFYCTDYHQPRDRFLLSN